MNAGLLLTTLPLIGDDPERVNQIRKIVVALAITGKLDSRAVSLPPAQILESVDRVKAALAKQGSLRKKKQYAPVNQLDLPDAFSDPSRFAPLGELALIEKGKTGIQQAHPGSFPLVVTAAERASCDHFDFDGSAAIIPLVSSTGHGNASLNRLHYQEGQFALGTILAGVFPHDPRLISARFLFEYLSAFKDELLVTRMTGTANVTLTIGRISEVPIPLVYPEVQKRVDELMALCDRLETARAEREATRDRLTISSLARLNAADPETFQDDARFVLRALPALTTRPDQIKHLRQTILNLAVSGKLVSQDPKDEPVEELLKRLKKERLALEASGKIRKEKGEAPAHYGGEQDFELPRTWVWARLIEIGQTKTGTSPSSGNPDLFGDFIPFIKPADLDGAEINYDGPGLSELGIGHSRLAAANSVLMVCIGATLGKVNTTTRSVCFNQQINSLTPFFDELSAFIALALKASGFQSLAWSKAGTGTLPIISKGKWEQLPIPLPPLAEQHRIVSKVDELMALCKQLEASLTDTAATRRHLLGALLADALEPD